MKVNTVNIPNRCNVRWQTHLTNFLYYRHSIFLYLLTTKRIWLTNKKQRFSNIYQKLSAIILQWSKRKSISKVDMPKISKLNHRNIWLSRFYFLTLVCKNHAPPTGRRCIFKSCLTTAVNNNMIVYGSRSASLFYITFELKL